MSSDDGLHPSRAARRADLVLPEDPSEEELARNWSLSQADNAQVVRCRGDDNRRRFALQICALRQYGRFLEDYSCVPVRILNHINRQLQLPPALSLQAPERNATETEHRERIREHLGYQTFDAAAQTLLEELLRSRVAAGALSGDLIEAAQDALRLWRIVAPARSTLERLATSIAVTGRQEILERITARIPDSSRQSLDALLEVAEGERQSGLMAFKEYPPEASPAAILDYVERYYRLQGAGVSAIDLAGIAPPVVDHLGQLAHKYNAQALKRFAAVTRHAMLACLLVEAQKSLLDHLATMHDQFVTGMARRSRNAFEERHREFRKRAKRGVETLMSAVEILLAGSHSDAFSRLEQQIDESTLRAALLDCREFQRLEDHGYQEQLRLRHSHLRRYLPAFLKLPFKAEPGTQPLLRAIEIARRLDEAGERALPKDAPTDFIPAAWRNSYTQPDGRVDKRLWDIALALSVRDALLLAAA